MTKPECGNLPDCKACGKCNEDLPESKPEKNCGNCGKSPCALYDPQKTFCHSWQPKPAEPQGWEQRLRENHPYCTAECNPNLIADIRAEIERKVEEEKQAIVKFLAKVLGVFPDEQFDIIISAIKLEIEQNKHRGNK